MGISKKTVDINKIDFVLPWVDGSDKEWIALKNKYLNSTNNLSSHPEANSDCRYRDCGFLKYLFRGMERFAPWVNRVFFVTCGQKPDWLDESNPKLRLVYHKEYIPADYLPTFQSNTIEINLHRIPDLSEQFVLFNDDTFLLRPVKPGFFFRKGLPVLPCDLGIPYWLPRGILGASVLINNSAVLYQRLNVNHLIRKNIWKYADVFRLGFRRASKNVLSFAVNKLMIPGSFGHMPQSHLKSTFEELWNNAPQIMDQTSRNRFRSDNGINQWLACSWNMVSGRFYPANEKRRGRDFEVDSGSLAKIYNAIIQQSFPLLCLIDRENAPEIDRCFLELSTAFDKLLPEKSSFEK